MLNVQYHVVISPGVSLRCMPAIFDRCLRWEDIVKAIRSVAVFECFVRDACNCQDKGLGVGFLKRLVCS